jgi:hypothetical protein
VLDGPDPLRATIPDKPQAATISTRSADIAGIQHGLIFVRHLRLLPAIILQTEEDSGLWFGNLQALHRQWKRIPIFIYWIVFAALLLLTRWSDGNYVKGVIPDLAGRAEVYHQEMLNRYEILSRSDNGDIVVPRIRIQPSFYQDDITTDPSDWRNQCAAGYFGKRSLRTAE